MLHRPHHALYDRPMITIEETIVVDADGRATLTLPPSVKPGPHRAVLQVDEGPGITGAADHAALIGFWRGNIHFEEGWKEPIEDFRPYLE